ncbi:MAG: diaminopimelate epimerase [Lysobacteraceae bacterium]
MNAVRHAPLPFTKMHGAGNDFVVIDLRRDVAPPSPELCRALADRHTGIGCDQILTIEPPRSAQAAASYRIWNADGSASQQCGNGARCIAAWVLRDSVARDPERCLTDRFELDSPNGTHAIDVIDLHHYRVAMGRPMFELARIPLRGFDTIQSEYTLPFGGEILNIGAVSMGNPHALIEVDDVDLAPVATFGPAVQRHEAFPESANVGFAQVVSRDRIRLRVFERGVGETRACGSGACAAAAVLMRRGRIDREVAVELPGGTLNIAWPDDNAQIAMSGPAAFVFEGEWWQ